MSVAGYNGQRNRCSEFFTWKCYPFTSGICWCCQPESTGTLHFNCYVQPCMGLFANLVNISTLACNASLNHKFFGFAPKFGGKLIGEVKTVSHKIGGKKLGECIGAFN